MDTRRAAYTRGYYTHMYNVTSFQLYHINMLHTAKVTREKACLGDW